MTARMMLPNNDEEHVRTYDDDGYSNDEEDGGGGGDDDADDGDGNAFDDVYVFCRVVQLLNASEDEYRNLRTCVHPTLLGTYGILAGSR